MATSRGVSLPYRRWLDRVRDDIKEKGLLGEEVYDHATNRSSTPHKSGNKMKGKNKKDVCVVDNCMRRGC